LRVAVARLCAWKTAGMSELGHEPTFAACQRNV
jgi:hypothetical protein